MKLNGKSSLHEYFINFNHFLNQKFTFAFPPLSQPQNTGYSLFVLN